VSGEIFGHHLLQERLFDSAPKFVYDTSLAKNFSFNYLNLLYFIYHPQRTLSVTCSVYTNQITLK
jgi:hypothetical protein